MRFGGWWLAVLVLLTCGACSSGAKGPLRLTDWKSGERMSLDVGREVEVRLDSNPSTGYYWVWADSAESGLEKIEATVFERRTDAIGGGGQEVWRFRAASPGSATLRLVYRRPMRSDLAEREVRYAFDVK